MTETPPDISGGGRISELLLEKEMAESYLNYSMSVILSRALPDARDGLKPSQRRVLVAMNDLNLGPRAKFRKCAKIAGDTSGNYHPHGEGVIYPTLVRLARLEGGIRLQFRCNLGDGHVCGGLDLGIRIEERHGKARGQCAADSGFAGPHHAHHHDRLDRGTISIQITVISASGID